MKYLQLDFSNFELRKRQRSNRVLVVILSLIALGLMLEYGRLTDHIAELEDSIVSSEGRKSIKQVKPTEQDVRKMKIAGVIYEKLNFPWHQLLSSLEVVKQDIPRVNLTAIQPNPTKGEVLIGGEAPDLETMLAFVSSLEAHPIFNSVLLVNQRQLKLDNTMSLAFTLKMGWAV